jgi:16S rRNA (guanine1516-N2)-methyltransferase
MSSTTPNATFCTTSIAAVCYSPLRLQQAKELCQKNDLPLLKALQAKSEKIKGHKKSNNEYDLLLIFHDDLVELYDRQLNTTISIDFLQGSLAHRQQFGGGRGQAIAKAVGLKSGSTPTVLDATAGMAGDAYVLATLGCPITLIERSPVIFALIENAIERASLNDSFLPISNQGFKAINCDAREYISKRLDTNDNTNRPAAPDVIYIDPMYPERKKSALVKKDMQILQRLHGDDEGAEELLEIALQYAKKRVVVKRPVHAPPLSNRKTSTDVKSKKTRYDIYAINKM